MTKRLYESDVEQFSAWNRQLKTLLREADEKIDKNDDEIDKNDDEDTLNGEKDDDVQYKKDTPEVKKFMEMGKSLGEDLYSIVPYNSLGSVWYGDASAEPNPTIIDIIKDATGVDYSLPVNNSDRISDDRMIPMIIYAVGKGDVIDFVANAADKTIKISPNLADTKLSPEQINIIKKLENTTKEWFNSIPKYVPIHATKPGTMAGDTDKKWKEAESKLRKMIENSGNAEVKSFADTYGLKSGKDMDIPWLKDLIDKLHSHNNDNNNDDNTEKEIRKKR